MRCIQYIFVVTIVASATLSSVYSYAQPASGTPSVQLDAKQQRKAVRKERRAKKNAELSALERNGYRPQNDQTSYPAGIQGAQQKLDAQKANGANPASGH